MPKKISLSRKDDFLTVEFHHLEAPLKEVYSGPYQGKTTLDGEDIEAVLDREVMSISDITDTLRSLTATVSNMEKSINKTLWIVGLGVAAIAILVALK